MRITKSKFRQNIKEELLREGDRFSIGGGVERYKEEQQVIDLTRELADLYTILQTSISTDDVMDMEAAYIKTTRDIKSHKMRQAGFYEIVGIAKAIVDLGLRPSSKDQEEYPDL